MKFQELKVDRLKRELSKLNLPTTGNKAELQKRLLEEFQQRGIDMDTYEFDDEEELEACSSAQAAEVNINAILAAMMKKMERMEVSFTAQNKALLAEAQETSRAENAALMAEVKQTSTALVATNEKLDEILVKLGKKDEGVAKSVTNLERAHEKELNELVTADEKELNELVTVDEKELNKLVTAEEKELNELVTVDKKEMSEVEDEVNSLQYPKVEPDGIIPKASSEISGLYFDGIPFEVFQLQYVTVARRSKWDKNKKAEIVHDRGYLVKRLKEVLEQLLVERQPKANAQIRSLICLKGGHLQAGCKMPLQKKIVKPPHRIIVNWRTSNNHRKRRRLRL